MTDRFGLDPFFTAAPSVFFRRVGFSLFRRSSHHVIHTRIRRSHLSHFGVDDDDDDDDDNCDSHTTEEKTTTMVSSSASSVSTGRELSMLAILFWSTLSFSPVCHGLQLHLPHQVVPAQRHARRTLFRSAASTDATSTDTAIEVDETDARSPFGTKEYWDETYLGRGDFCAEEYSWYYGFEVMKQYVSEMIPDKSSRILLPGIGNDSMAADLIDCGYTNLVAFDYSEHAIERQHDLLWDVPSGVTVELLQLDARNLPTEWAGSFDAVIEKGALDAIYLSGSDNEEAAVEEITRVLRPGGIVISVSGVVPAERRRELFADYEWIRDGTDDLKAGCFLLRKQ